MVSIRYADFDLEVQAEGQGFRAHVRSAGGEASVAFGQILPELELENYLLKLGQPRRSTRRIDSPANAAAKALGRRLFDTVFANDVRSCLRTSLELANQQEIGLRIRLHLKNVPVLANLPWEYIYDEALDRFLVLSRLTPLVRYLPLPEPIRALKVSLPLRVLVMISSPEDYQRLDVEQEWVSLNKAVEPMKNLGLLTITRLDKATAGALHSQLLQGEFHVFHFIGHGGFDSATQDGELVLEDERGKGRPTSGEKLGVFLHDHRSMRLAILNACEGARSSTTDPFSGVAQTLIRQGIPAVVGMQFEITDEAAITFATRFYNALAEGSPVDAALAGARMAIYAENEGLEWGTPALYMRSPDGCIFEMQSLAPAEPQTPQVTSPSISRPQEDYQSEIEPVSLPERPVASGGQEHSKDVSLAATVRSPTTASDVRYTHHATAFALGGRFSLPVEESILPRGMITLAGIGGHTSQSVRGFHLRGIVSFASAHASAAGNQSPDSLFQTSASVVVEGLNILDTITADRVVARLTSTHAPGASEPSIVSIGSHFENLRIAGWAVHLGMAGDELLGGATYSEARRAFRPGNYFSAVRGFPKKGTSKVKNPPGLLTLAKDSPVSMGSIQCHGHVYRIPHFGNIHLAEIEVLPHSRRLVMMKINLGSTVSGDIMVAGCECGGSVLSG